MRAAWTLMLTMAALLLPVASSSAETVTTLGDSGDGSLRAAIANAAPGETIDFQAGLEGTIELATGLTVAKDLRIAGPGARHLAISGMDVTRVLHVDGAGTELEIDDVTIRDGVTPDDEPFGGGVLVTGGDRVRLTRVAVLNNVAQGTGGPFGGGIAAFVGRLELRDSTVAGNRAAAGGGGIAVGVPFEVVNSTVADNSSGAGAGLLARAGAMGTVRHTTFSGNTAAVKGHAIGADGTSLVTVERSLLPGNGPAGQPPCDGSVASGGGNVSDAPCFAAPAAGDVVAAAPVGALADNGGPTDTMMPLAGNPALGHVPAPVPAERPARRCSTERSRVRRRRGRGAGAGPTRCSLRRPGPAPRPAGSASVGHDHLAQRLGPHGGRRPFLSPAALRDRRRDALRRRPEAQARRAPVVAGVLDRCRRQGPRAAAAVPGRPPPAREAALAALGRDAGHDAAGRLEEDDAPGRAAAPAHPPPLIRCRRGPAGARSRPPRPGCAPRAW